MDLILNHKISLNNRENYLYILKTISSIFKIEDWVRHGRQLGILLFSSLNLFDVFDRACLNFKGEKNQKLYDKVDMNLMNYSLTLFDKSDVLPVFHNEKCVYFETFFARYIKMFIQADSNWDFWKSHGCKRVNSNMNILALRNLKKRHFKKKISVDSFYFRKPFYNTFNHMPRRLKHIFSQPTTI